MIIEKYKEVLEELCQAMEDAEKAELGNASAGRRLRKASLNAIKELKSLRSIVLEHTRK